MKNRAFLFLLPLLLCTGADASPDSRPDLGADPHDEHAVLSGGEPPQSVQRVHERLSSVPGFPESLIVNDRRDIEERLPELAPDEATSFRFEYKHPKTAYKMQPGPFVAYTYRQWIHDVATENLVKFFVHIPTRRLAHVSGKIRTDPDIPTAPGWMGRRPSKQRWLISAEAEHGCTVSPSTMPAATRRSSSYAMAPSGGASAFSSRPEQSTEQRRNGSGSTRTEASRPGER